MSACSASTCLTAASTLTIISVAGMFSEVTAKFRPFFHKAISASLMDLEDKLITQLGLPTDGVTGDDTVACFFKKYFKLLLLLSLVVLKTRSVLIFISSSILSASSVERADIMLCAVDSASLFTSPLAFCVSLILFLGNLMDASSATLLAPLGETGGRTCRSFGTMWFLMHLVRKRFTQSKLTK